MLLRKVYYAMPLSVRSIARKFVYFPQDFLMKITGKADDLTPPKGSTFIGSGDFKKQGKQYFEHFKKLTHLKPNHQILDVGCGMGRMAVPFLDYLEDDGAFYGFDIMQEGIDWCNNNIASRRDNFHFEKVDLYNPLYNKKGALDSTDFDFPYADDQFDLVILTSVFTHLMPEEIEHYLSEIARVLKPGGECLITYFLLDDVALKHLENGKSQMDFEYKKNRYRLMSEKVPTANVAFDLDYIEGLYKKNGFKSPSIYYGWWRGIDKEFDFQDMVVGVKM